MVKTEVINDTGGELSLKEGNAGVYRDIKKLAPKGTHTIEIDPNATYREYVVVSTPSGEKVFVTSDDCIDNSTITIYVDKDNVYKFNGKARGDTSQAEEAAPNFFSKLFKRIFPSKK
ncbi:hypothetical protein M758_3G081700 [Ceratodon purpureus]|uniref:DUF7748 domain-containing protein n=1 Tax=Ceratodon purpureus TaxID=3225 RepID=A0A8T0IHB9_CERPU|nr:hypothetical protein KC19_3G080500 [Ceratodon purpureus]KAG0622225.1 hypothetical protein M758_3G081700 [Ceratodon purpureus]